MSAAVLADDHTFVAYYGDDHFDLDRARAENADFSFVAIRGPLAALDGTQRTLSLSQRTVEPWTISYNLGYGAGGTVEWSVLRFVPGQDGLSGVVGVTGNAENLGVVAARYQLGFVGRMDLPVVGDANLEISIENNGGAPAQFEE